MIAFLNGNLAGKTADMAYVECNGVGFAVGMSANSLAKMPGAGHPVQIYTYLQVREDAMTLFGFATLEEKALFEKLVGVSGVGPKMALAALSTFGPQALVDAIMGEDVALVSRIPGVGKKTAQRIILELRGTLETSLSQDDAAAPARGGAAAIVVEDLMAMGFTQAEAELACRGMSADADEAKGLQYALKRLGE